jgi:hypothetical protein
VFDRTVILSPLIENKKRSKIFRDYHSFYPTVKFLESKSLPLIMSQQSSNNVYQLQRVMPTAFVKKLLNEMEVNLASLIVIDVI